MILLKLLAYIFNFPLPAVISRLVSLLSTLIILIAVLIILSKILTILKALAENDQKLENLLSSLQKNREILTQINQNTQLSEAARKIASREADQQALRELVFDMLQQEDFDSTYEIINEIAQSTPYQELAEQLKNEADRFQNAGDTERINQVIAHIEKLFDSYEWAKASAQIERLIKAEPNSEQAKELRQKMTDKKEERKKVLLNAWDDAVRREATNRSLEILRDLDQYLTPNEALALQEAARDVFRNKLHSLGVGFSLAVSGKQWAKALKTGMEISRDFPNSKMAEEIREKMGILKQKVEEQS
jgi:hypothetical protein